MNEYIEEKFNEIIYNCGGDESGIEDTIKQIIADTKEACKKALEYSNGYRDGYTVERIDKAEIK